MRLLRVLALAMVLVVGISLPVLAGSDVNPGDIVINEIMQNPSKVGDSEGEYFEIYNTTSSNIDINGWTIKDKDSDSDIINNGGPLNVPAHGYLVLCNNTNSGTNGGFSCDYQYSSSINLANGADEVILQEDSGGQQIIAEADYDGGPNWPDPNGASMVYIPSGKPPSGGYFNDNNDGSRWGTSTSSYGDGDKGTPGSTNDQGGVPNAVTVNHIAGMSSPFAGLAAAVVLAGGLVVLRRRH